MTEFQSKWDGWKPKTQENRTDSTDNASPDTALSALSVQKTDVLPLKPSHQATAEAAPQIEPACLICGKPADDRNSNIVSGKPIDRRVHFIPDCYGVWFKTAFGRNPAGSQCVRRCL